MIINTEYSYFRDGVNTLTVNLAVYESGIAVISGVNGFNGTNQIENVLLFIIQPMIDLLWLAN